MIVVAIMVSRRYGGVFPRSNEHIISSGLKLVGIIFSFIALVEWRRFVYFGKKVVVLSG